MNTALYIAPGISRQSPCWHTDFFRALWGAIFYWQRNIYFLSSTCRNDVPKNDRPLDYACTIDVTHALTGLPHYPTTSKARSPGGLLIARGTNSVQSANQMQGDAHGSVPKKKKNNYIVVQGYTDAYHAGASSPSFPPSASSSFENTSGHRRWSALNPDLLLSPWLLHITPAGTCR